MRIPQYCGRGWAGPERWTPRELHHRLVSVLTRLPPVVRATPITAQQALQPGSPGTVTPGAPSPDLKTDEPVKQAAVAPQRVAQALGVNAIAIPLVAQPAFALLGAGH
jgi:hypothetical protein